MKKSITCKGITPHSINREIINSYVPMAGDVALFEVISIGKHDSIQSATGHNCYLFEGDTFLAAFGTRYATEQFEGYLPKSPVLELDILGKGGVVGVIESMHCFLKDVGTTRVRLLGYGMNEYGQVINSKYHNKQQVTFHPSLKPNGAKIILSLGCSMDSGKTTTAGYLSRSLTTRGKKVEYIKLTGTYFTKDRQFVQDCGAETSIDFGTAGFPSTYMIELDELLNLYQYLLNLSKENNNDYIVIEIADGILQRETEMLINNGAFKETIDHVIFSAVDSLSALYGIEKLSKLGLQPMAVSGLFTASPLLHKEVESRTNVPVLNLNDLLSTDFIALMGKKELQMV